MSCVEENAAARDGFILPGHSNGEGGAGERPAKPKKERTRLASCPFFGGDYRTRICDLLRVKQIKHLKYLEKWLYFKDSRHLHPYKIRACVVNLSYLWSRKNRSVHTKFR